jgi:hypothetical protein
MANLTIGQFVALYVLALLPFMCIPKTRKYVPGIVWTSWMVIFVALCLKACHARLFE